VPLTSHAFDGHALDFATQSFPTFLTNLAAALLKKLVDAIKASARSQSTQLIADVCLGSS
jgi:hypothetical protein